MAGEVQTLGWDDLEGLVQILRSCHPRVDPRSLTDEELAAMVEELAGFDPARGKAGLADYETVRAMWHWGV